MDNSREQDKGKGHRQRLRDKFAIRGIDALNDDEVLELLLTMGTPRRDCKDCARLLLKRFGSLAAVLEATPFELQTISGIGAQNGFAIHFIQSVARRYLNQRLRSKNYLRSSREVGDYLIHAMRDLKKEVFQAIFLDASFAIIDTKILFEGTLSVNTVYPREFIKTILANHAAAVVIAHNHPSGSLTPSAADRKLTRNLFLACAMIDVQLLDHLIVGAGESPFSFADHGLMDEIKQECLPLL
ncbi:MAG: DNA repair protein RadC [Proteobacteria bacterium]|nr:DNA repair protein RadC [Pseudomonadota bacterium]MBU4296855.1 DNA repair protein RadC [Pseudomonadota bacterium]MCG2746366.1 DNA repair protein RadC [Desulfobulbaceae bacterium]